MAEPSERDLKMAIDAIKRCLAEERDAWKAWAEETIKGTAEGQKIARAEGEAEGRRKAVEAVRHCPSVDENGYICEKSAAIKAIRALAEPPADGSGA